VAEYPDEDQIAPAKPSALISSESGKRNEFIGHAMFQTLAGMALLTTLVWCDAVWAQEPSAPPASPQQDTLKNVTAPCVEPPPMVRWEDYQGPFKKIVGTFARSLERKAVHPPHYKPGAVLCILGPKEKLSLFVQDTFDPVTFLYAGFNAGLGQAGDEDPTFGQGAEGFGKRFGAHFADQALRDFFKDFAYPSIFSEDPRYYRLAYGSGGSRLLHAVGHAFVAHREDGTRMFNFSEWLGTTSAIALSNLYHPGNERGVAPAARRTGYSVLEDMGFDILREFWPEIARKLRLPFRDKRESEPQDSGHDAK
jgi:hypothetical protein